MSDKKHNILQASHQDSTEHAELSAAIDHVIAELRNAARVLHDEADDAFKAASVALSDAAQDLSTSIQARSAEVSKSVVHDVKAHPLAAAGAVAMAAAALAALVLASQAKPAPKAV